MVLNLPFSNWEIILYSLCSVSPCVALAEITFRRWERYSRRTTVLACVLVIVMQTLLNFSYFYNLMPLAFLVDLFGGLVYFLSLMWLFKVPFSRLLFFLLAYSGYGNFFVVMGKHIESVFSAAYAAQRYRWSFSICVLAVEAVCLPVLYFIFFKPFAELMDENADSHLWRYLWLAPATFYLIWALWFYAYPTSVIERSTENMYWICKLLVDSGSLLIYRLILMLVKNHNEKLALMKRTYAQDQQITQYAALVARMDSVRTVRHDIRHHLGAIRQYAEENELQKIPPYIDDLMGGSALKAPLIYCKNTAGNAVLQYYAYQAARQDIRCDIRIVIPEESFVEATDITVLIGNLFTNAIEAIVREEIADALITVKGRPQSDSIYTFYVENPSTAEPETDAHGHCLSHHHEGAGIGLTSVEGIAEKYDGHMEISHENGLFRVSVMLCRG